MSKFRFTVVAVVLVSALSSAASARERGLFGLGPLGSLGFAINRLFAPGMFHRGRVHHYPRAQVRSTRNSPEVSQGVASATTQPMGKEEPVVGRLFADPAARRQVAGTAALALWQDDHHATDGWWSHGHGGYGWVGPLFWPFAYDDVYGYAIFSEGMGFWDYGYPDIYAGIFGPYGKNELAAYMSPDSSGRRERRIPPMQQLCGDGRGEIAGLAIDRIQRAIQPSESQRHALNHLADASVSAARIIQASCPTQPVSTAPARLALMQRRAAAILEAAISLEPPLQDLYDLLNDDQKKRLNALANSQLKTPPVAGTMTVTTGDCEAPLPAALEWPAGEIERRLHPTDAQRDALKRLQRASGQAVDILRSECPSADAITPPERLAAVDRRLDALQDAINLVSIALDEFYDRLSDEQKSQFELIGSERAL